MASSAGTRTSRFPNARHGLWRPARCSATTCSCSSGTHPPRAGLLHRHSPKSSPSCTNWPPKDSSRTRSTAGSSGRTTPCRLTAKGQEAALFIHERRRTQADGLSIDEWSPLYVPEQGTEDEFREYADQHVISPEGDCYDSTPHLMLRRRGSEPAEGQKKPRQTHLFFEEDIWTTRPAQPVGYFFFENLPAIAFDIDDVQMLAEHYEVIRAVAGPGVRWTVMDPAPANPVCLEGTGARTIRADGPATKAAAFFSIFRPPGERPGIRLLRKRTRQQDGANEDPRGR